MVTPQADSDRFGEVSPLKAALGTRLPRLTLAARLNLVVAICFVVIGGLSIAFVVHDSKNHVEREVVSTVNAVFLLIDRLLDEQGLSLSSAGALEGVRQGVGATGGGSRPNADDESLVLDLSVGADDENSDRLAAQAPAWYESYLTPQKREYSRVLTFAGHPDIELTIRTDPTPEIAQDWQATRTLLGLFLAACVLVNVVIFALIRRALQPLEDFELSMQAVSRGQFGVRISGSRAAEWDHLVAGFNQMTYWLQHSIGRNRDLARRVLTVQEEERRALAQELHDELGQSITAINTLASAINAHCSAQTACKCGLEDSVTMNSNHIKSISADIYATTRSIMRRLRPPLLDQLGFSEAVREMVDNWMSTHERCRIDLEIVGDFARLPSGLGISLYRIIQEALTNVSKHSNATRVAIDISRSKSSGESCLGDELIRLVIDDNGVGFDPDAVTWGMGLMGMSERVEAEKGSISIGSSPDGGARLAFSIPLFSVGMA